MTNKNSIDYNRDFVLAGTMNISSRPEGFVLALHNTPNYTARSSGGSIGIYKDERDGGTNGNGLGNALTVEIDTHNNTVSTDTGTNTGHYGDSPDYGQGGSHSHLAIHKTGSDGAVIENLKQVYKSDSIDLYALLNKEMPFKFVWKLLKVKSHSV